MTLKYLLLILMLAGPAWGTEIVFSCGATGTEFRECQTTARLWEKKTGNTVKVVSAPASATERLALYQMLLAARSSDVDVFPMDVIWPGVIGSHFIDLAPFASREFLADHFPAYIENNTVDGKLLAMPGFIDAGLLYYRKDLLQKYGEAVPSTWQELERIARKIQSHENTHGQMWGYVFQGRAYEGLTCNALEWLVSFGAGTVVNDQGEITVRNSRSVEALTLVRGWIGTIAPEGVLNYGEEEVRGLFQSGHAIFMHNWPYAWQLSQSPDSPVRGKVGVALLPKGPAGVSAAALGGWSYAVSKYSQHQKEAVDFVLFMTSREQQKRRAIASSFNPTLLSLYRDDQLFAAQPFMRDLLPAFQNSVPRPSRWTHSRYNKVSAEFWDAVHSVLAKQQEPEPALQDLEKRLQRIRRGGRW